jgi:hypothetical protein
VRETGLPEVGMHMQGKKQLERGITVGAPAGVVYRLFMDNAELANWARPAAAR